MSAAQRQRTKSSERVVGSDDVLKPGDEGDAVRLLQQRLGDVGFDVGPLDGRYDERTTLRVQAFQVATGLAVTGQVDKEFWRRLNSLPKLGSATPLPYGNPLNHLQPHQRPDYFPDGPPVLDIPWQPTVVKRSARGTR